MIIEELPSQELVAPLLGRYKKPLENEITYANIFKIYKDDLILLFDRRNIKIPDL